LTVAWARFVNNERSGSDTFNLLLGF